MYRTYAYIDGCTLTRRLIQGGVRERIQLFDLVALVTPLVPFDHNLLAIRYYANIVSTQYHNGSVMSHATESPIRRHTYFSPQTSAIVQLPCPAPPDPDEYEGERDVPLVVHLLRDGARDAYDVAIIITDDVTLADPIEIVTRRLRKRVGLLWPSANSSAPLARVSSFTRYLSDAHMAVAQIP